MQRLGRGLRFEDRAHPRIARGHPILLPGDDVTLPSLTLHTLAGPSAS